VQLRVRKVPTIGIVLGKLQGNAPGARFDVRPERESNVGRKAELDLIGQSQVGFRLRAAQVARSKRLAGDGSDEGGILDVALTR